MAEYNWAILGCGVIAHQLARCYESKRQGTLQRCQTERMTKRFPLPKNTALKKVYGKY